MRAVVLPAIQQPLSVRDVPAPIVGTDEVVVALHYAALNRRDLFITQGQYGGIQLPAILGSDGAGVLGSESVLINPSFDWGEDARAQGGQFKVLGMPRQGTFAESIAVPPDQIHPVPRHLSLLEAAALPLAGLTAYRALVVKGQVRAGERVFITGIGGGVALFALQFAVALGAEVWVSSSQPAKLERARSYGATNGVDYTDPDWIKTLQAAGGIDLVIDGAGGAGLGQLLKVCRPAARVVLYGGTTGVVPNFSPQIVFWKQLQILGTTMGTSADFAAMLDLVTRYRLQPIIDRVYPLHEVAQAFDRLQLSAQFGKIILDVSA